MRTDALQPDPNTRHPDISRTGPGPAPGWQRLHNRVDAVMTHVSRYQFEGRARLATDVGVSRSTISRMLNGQTTPSYDLVRRVTAALSRHLGRPLDPSDLFSPSGSYRERSACRLSDCRGCLPERAFDGRGRRRPEWRDARPGDWSLAPEADACASSHQP